MAIENFTDGYVMEIVAVEHDRWDYRLTLTHPQRNLEWQTFVSGGAPIVDAVRNRLLREARGS